MVLYGCVTHEHVLYWYCPDIAVLCIKKHHIFIVFQVKYKFMFTKIKGVIRKGNEIYIIIMHYFNNIPRPIQTNHLWLHNSMHSLQRRSVLGWPFQHMKTKRSFFLGSLWWAVIDLTEWRSKNRSASNRVYLDWGSVAIISSVGTLCCGKGSSAFCLEVVIAICLSLLLLTQLCPEFHYM